MRHSFPDFATVLKEAEAERDSADRPSRLTDSLASAVFSAGFSPASNGTYPTEKTVPQFDFQDFETDQGKLDREMRELAKRMESQSPASIRRELNLRPEMKRAELQQLRRRFAAQNHPDRLPQEFRLAAEQRMKTANALLDSAMASATNEL
ncbi:hypothetical protein [Brucella grignonensis]|uniref:J domain-containing protein n=1 Tax=Brucella grignonensis TaxID=94627 RepID=A0A256F735_9HYPH|nr:hypothetical protein [Brucella grignonensis]OYR10560.1 hypothetical protein CEV33_2022 [Brucella grignonensis]